MARIRTSFLKMRIDSRSKTAFWPVLLLALLLPAPCLAADEPGSKAPVPAIPPWNPIDTLPDLHTPGLSLAWRSETPSLADRSHAASEWGYELIAAGPASNPLEDGSGESQLFSVVPTFYGGYAGKLIGGAYSAFGAAFGGDDPVLAFLAAGADVEFTADNDEDGNGSRKLKGFANLSGGIAGAIPFPWSLSARATAGDASVDPRAEILAEASTFPLLLRNLGRRPQLFRAALASGVRVGAATGYPMAFILRSTLKLEGRNYEGALAEGTALAVDSSALWMPFTGDHELAAGISASAAFRFGDKAGLAARSGYRYNSSGTTDWSRWVRICRDSGNLSGDLGLTASLELPLLFARGTLFKSERERVEFFLKPFIDVLLLRDGERVLFERESLRGDGGLELAMTLDSDRRDALRAGAGIDLSPWMRGADSFPTLKNLEVYLLIAITM